MENNIDLAKKYFLSGDSKFDKGLFKESSKDFQKSLDYFPNRLSTLSKLLICKIKLDQYEECEKIVTLINSGISYKSIGLIMTPSFIRF